MSVTPQQGHIPGMRVVPRAMQYVMPSSVTSVMALMYLGAIVRPVTFYQSFAVMQQKSTYLWKQIK